MHAHAWHLTNMNRSLATIAFWASLEGPKICNTTRNLHKVLIFTLKLVWLGASDMRLHAQAVACASHGCGAMNVVHLRNWQQTLMEVRLGCMQPPIPQHVLQAYRIS
jgi:hypothetical protein